MSLMERICGGTQGMGLITSHAPSLLRRVPPESIRHFRLDNDELYTHVNSIRIPENDDEASKFVRQAVISRPEIYFASLVVLGEGESEELVLPFLARAFGVDLDPSFISFAPLGGRHVNHFWRLLSDLNIPHITLLDFDLGRYAAGPLRLKYAYDQLNEIQGIEAPTWVNGDPETMRYWKSRRENGIRKWRRLFAEHNVFFSYPLDLDMSMVRAFPDAYDLDQTEALNVDEIDDLATSVFGKGPGLVAYEQKAPEGDHPSTEELSAYDKLFKRRSKPSSHLKALSELSNDDVTEFCPEPLRQLIQRANEILGIGQHRAGD